MKKVKAIIMGAAGRDFHNFNVYFQNNPYYKVVAFTAFQIPNIANRKYKGISIYPEEQLLDLIEKTGAQEVFFSYSDVSYENLMQKAAIVMSANAGFNLLGKEQTMIKSNKPVIAVTAVRTGCGKSAVSQKIADYFFKKGLRTAIVRHPMPYGDLKKQVCQKLVSLEDLNKYNCTIEEREEYEPYLEKGLAVYTGVDYEKILHLAEKNNDIILWDGGNNDMPFYKPNLYICLADARRPRHEIGYYPGEINFRSADIIIISKIVDKDSEKNAKIIFKNARQLNPEAKIIKGGFSLIIDKPKLVKGKKVLVVEDGPSMTHGGLCFGAGFDAAKKFKAGQVVDPRPYALGSLKKIFKEYPHLKKVLPAMGYSKQQRKELEKSINKIPCNSVIIGTPSKLENFLKINKPFVRVKYAFEEIKGRHLEKVLDNFIKMVL